MAEILPVGTEFTFLTVRRLAMKSEKPKWVGNSPAYACTCACGSKRVVIATLSELKRGMRKSCGCLMRQHQQSLQQYHRNRPRKTRPMAREVILRALLNATDDDLFAEYRRRKNL